MESCSYSDYVVGISAVSSAYLISKLRLVSTYKFSIYTFEKCGI